MQNQITSGRVLEPTLIAQIGNDTVSGVETSSHVNPVVPTAPITQELPKNCLTPARISSLFSGSKAMGNSPWHNEQPIESATPTESTRTMQADDLTPIELNHLRECALCRSNLVVHSKLLKMDLPEDVVAIIKDERQKRVESARENASRASQRAVREVVSAIREVEATSRRDEHKDSHEIQRTTEEDCPQTEKESTARLEPTYSGFPYGGYQFCATQSSGVNHDTYSVSMSGWLKKVCSYFENLGKRRQESTPKWATTVAFYFVSHDFATYKESFMQNPTTRESCNLMLTIFDQEDAQKYESVIKGFVQHIDFIPARAGKVAVTLDCRSIHRNWSCSGRLDDLQRCVTDAVCLLVEGSALVGAHSSADKEQTVGIKAKCQTFWRQCCQVSSELWDDSSLEHSAIGIITDNNQRKMLPLPTIRADPQNRGGMRDKILPNWGSGTEFALGPCVGVVELAQQKEVRCVIKSYQTQVQSVRKGAECPGLTQDVR